MKCWGWMYTDNQLDFICTFKQICCFVYKKKKTTNKSKMQFGTILWLLTALMCVLIGKILYSVSEWNFWETGNSSKFFLFWVIFFPLKLYKLQPPFWIMESEQAMAPNKYSFLSFILLWDYRLDCLPWWLSGKESTCQCSSYELNPWPRNIPQRRKWKPSPLFLPGKSHRERVVEGYSPCSRKRLGHDLVTNKQQNRQ